MGAGIPCVTVSNFSPIEEIECIQPWSSIGSCRMVFWWSKVQVPLRLRIFHIIWHLNFILISIYAIINYGSYFSRVIWSTDNIGLSHLWPYTYTVLRQLLSCCTCWHSDVCHLLQPQNTRNSLAPPVHHQLCTKTHLENKSQYMIRYWSNTGTKEIECFVLFGLKSYWQ